jgi:hypothetical protein
VQENLIHIRNESQLCRVNFKPACSQVKIYKHLRSTPKTSNENNIDETRKRRWNFKAQIKSVTVTEIYTRKSCNRGSSNSSWLPLPFETNFSNIMSWKTKQKCGTLMFGFKCQVVQSEVDLIWFMKFRAGYWYSSTAEFSESWRCTKYTVDFSSLRML